MAAKKKIGGAPSSYCIERRHHTFLPPHILAPHQSFEVVFVPQASFVAKPLAPP